MAEVGLENGPITAQENSREGNSSELRLHGRSSPGRRVLLADEPTGDLDEQNAWAVFELLERLHRTHKLTSLIATHNLALAGRCDRVLGLEHGVLRTRAVKAAASGDPGGEAS